MDPRPPNMNDHPSELLLPHVEGLLSGPERAAVEEHLRGCAQCADAVAGLRDTVTALKEHKEAFCPEPWELYEYVHYGIEPAPDVKKHVESCHSCRQVLESLKSRPSKEDVPAAILDKIRAGGPRPAPRLDDRTNWWESISHLFRRPIFGAVAAATAVLVVFFLYPREVPQYPIAFSSVTWESVPKPKAFAPSMPRIALVLAVKECEAPLYQRSIDSLYESLAPSMDLYERFQVVSPAAVHNGLRKFGKRIDSRARLLEGLRTQLDVSLACLVTVECKAERMSIKTELVDTSSGAVRADAMVTDASHSELNDVVRKTAHDILMSASK